MAQLTTKRSVTLRLHTVLQASASPFTLVAALLVPVSLCSLRIYCHPPLRAPHLKLPRYVGLMLFADFFIFIPQEELAYTYGHASV